MHSAGTDLSRISFDPALTLDCGQAFRWSPVGDSRTEWIGIVSGTLVRVNECNAKAVASITDRTKFDEIMRSYFSFTDDLESILSSFPRDDVLSPALRQFRGLRLLTQDPWECLISFVCSINCNIPSIKLKIENLSRRFGTRIHTGLDIESFAFPTAERLAKAGKKALLECKVGFRWKYIEYIAKEVATGRLDVAALSSLPYKHALSHLISQVSGKTFGVGPKVADCVLLYALHKTEAFPIDVWIWRGMRHFYKESMRGANCKSLTVRNYFQISELMRKKFGKYAGIAQLYLYAKIRQDARLTQGKLQV